AGSGSVIMWMPVDETFWIEEIDFHSSTLPF
ncbi:MAG: hypothetical protein ACI9HY_000264, partial [Planctomycetaceae bacterium]